ncbi:MAG TPA: lipid-A-disaccharide synthase [Gammaproteobacteria bacterium]|nr:lipid-A-disaccharide synthase [Gammaproteobacteria bacterium]
MPRVAIIAGEPSGDRLAAALIRALRAQRNDLEFCGIAGPEMIAAGCSAWAPMGRLAVMGIGEILRRYRELRVLQHQVIDFLKIWLPDVFIGVDAPEFNLALEERLHASGIRCIHYVSPSVWAWRERRLQRLRRAVDRLLVLFPFEETYYRDRGGVPFRFVGHPLADELRALPDRASLRVTLGLTPFDRVLALLPGSRENELRHHAKIFLRTAALCRKKFPDLKVLVPLVSEDHERLWRDLLPDAGPEVRFPRGRSREALAVADAALITSGTATLEAMLLGCPMVVAYRASWLSYAFIRPLLRLRRFSLPNLIARSSIVPEYIQGAARPGALALSLLELLQPGAAAAARQRKRFARLAGQFPPNASARAADAVLELLP